MAVLSVEHLRKQFQGKRRVDDVSLALEAGEIVGLLGSNGAGKTTLFRMTSGDLRPDSGRVLLNDADVTKLSLRDRVRHGRMSYLPQEPSIFGKLTVANNLLTIMHAWGVETSERERRCYELLERFEIRHLQKIPAGSLSGGQRRRLELARCLLSSPKIILLDEPYVGLDPITIEQIRKLILSLRQGGLAVLITDHNVYETLKIVDRAYIMHGGKILCHGSPDELVLNAEVRRHYFGEQFAQPQTFRPDQSGEGPAPLRRSA